MNQSIKYSKVKSEILVEIAKLEERNIVERRLLSTMYGYLRIIENEAEILKLKEALRRVEADQEEFICELQGKVRDAKASLVLSQLNAQRVEAIKGLVISESV